jgi:hypothetical protein
MPDLTYLSDQAIPADGAIPETVTIPQPPTETVPTTEGVPPINTPIPEQPAIPQEEVTIDVANNSNTITSNPQPAPEAPLDTLSTTNPQETLSVKMGIPVDPEKPELGTYTTVEPVIEKIQCDRCKEILNSKAELPAHNLAKHNGRPCKFCENKAEFIKISKEYLASCIREDKPRIPYLNELAIKLQAHRETFYEWRQSEHDHGEFPYLIKELETIQEFRLQQRIMGRYNPTGGMFLLKTKHGYIETEKQILAGDKAAEPIHITITEEKPTLTDE